MGKIVKYHPVYLVRKNGDYYRLDVTCDDWYDDTQVIDKLVELSGAPTYGAIVEAVLNGQVNGGCVLDTQCHLVDGLVADAHRVLDYDQRVNSMSGNVLN